MFMVTSGATRRAIINDQGVVVVIRRGDNWYQCVCFVFVLNKGVENWFKIGYVGPFRGRCRIVIGLGFIAFGFPSSYNRIRA